MVSQQAQVDHDLSIRLNAQLDYEAHEYYLAMSSLSRLDQPRV